MNRLSGRFGQLLRAFSGEEDPSKAAASHDNEDKLHSSGQHHTRPPAFGITSPLEDDQDEGQAEEERYHRASVPRATTTQRERYDPFAGPIKVSLSPGVSHGTTGKGGSPPQIPSIDLKRKGSLEKKGSLEWSGGGGLRGGGEDYGDDEEFGEDDDEEEEEELKPFDAKKAHETFIWRALQGVMTARGDASSNLSNTLDLSASSQKRNKSLKWADEGGGELNNVQFFDKNAEPSTVLRLMLAADARAEGAPGSGKAAMGREEIVKNMEPILQQIKGNIQEVFPIKMMKNGETRTVLIAGRGPFRTRVGVAIVWMGGLIKHLKMIKNPEPEFLEDPPEDLDSAAPDEDICTPRSTESELFVLDAPYLVPRPDVFPTPTLLVQVISAHGLKSSATLPRPVNPYVKLKLGSVELRTNVMTNTKNPVWGGQDHHSRFRFIADDPNAMFRVTVSDWKIGKNVWIARLAIPLASIEASEPEDEGVLKEFDLRLRVSRFGKHIEKEGASDARLVLRLKYEYMERSWTMKELKARDEARIREEIELEEEASSLFAEGGGGGREAGQPACRVM